MIRSCFETCEQVMEENGLLAIFAEGGRSRVGHIARIVNPSTAYYLTLKEDTLVIPIGIEGTQIILPPNAHFPRKFGPAKITFGTPIPVDKLQARVGNPTQKNYNQLLINEVMYEVADLLPKKYRGVYDRATPHLVNY